MATASQPQTNGVLPGSQPSQPTQNTTSSGSATIPATQTTSGSGAVGGDAPMSPTTTSAPRPRDARTIELLLTSQGVTSFDPRVPLLLLDFAYRHTSSVLSDALHLTTDPYTSAAGSKPSGTSGNAPSAPSGSDAVVSTNAVAVAIASRQAYQFRGGSGAGGSGGGGASKEWLQELARERNRVALPRVLANEWGVRLPSERFVLSGVSWGLRDEWAAEEGESEDETSETDAMEGVEGGAEGTKPAEEEGGLDEYLGEDMEEDEDMEGME